MLLVDHVAELQKQVCIVTIKYVGTRLYLNATCIYFNASSLEMLPHILSDSLSLCLDL